MRAVCAVLASVCVLSAHAGVLDGVLRKGKDSEGGNSTTTTGVEERDTTAATATTTTSTTTTEEEGEDKEVCFPVLGCFDMGKPWKSALRPLPSPFAPAEIPVRMLFFAGPDTDEEHVVTTYPEVDLGTAPFDASKPIVVITHGFSNNGSSEWLHDLKDAYLSKMDANVMITDWGPGAQMWNYLQVSANTRVVARLVANVLKHVFQKYGAGPEQVHLIGHSLGAQISSYVAKELPRVRRLTALDPAQPGFEGFDKVVRLDESDAEFVDVIHTDAKPFIPTLGFGMVKPHGHVDFYVNGGFEQPGCIVPEDAPKITGFLDLAKFPVELIGKIKSCNHGRAHQYLIEAFNQTDDCIFWGHRASAENVARAVTHTLTQGLLSEYVALSSTCTKDDCIPLGFGTERSPLRGIFVVTTANRSPYCISEPGVPADATSPTEDSKRKPLGHLSDAAQTSVSKIGKKLKSLFE